MVRRLCDLRWVVGLVVAMAALACRPSGLVEHPGPLVPPTVAASSSGASSGTTGTTGSQQGSGALCSPCQQDTDCGEVGVALCVMESASDPSGYCAPACVSDGDCDPGAQCFPTDTGTSVCYPSSGSCVGQPAGATSGGASTGAASTGAASTAGASSSGAGTSGQAASSAGATASSSGGSTGGEVCGSKVGPDVTASCTCAAGHTCAANNCYGGWWCDTATNRCGPPPTSGCTFGSSGSTTGSGSTSGSHSSSSSGSHSSSSSGSSGGHGSTGGSGSGVGPAGGSVNLLHFAVSGDTRPPACEDTADYPTAIINAIGDAERQKGAQFALDLGDHMYVCNNDLQVATDQMNLFLQGVAHYGGTWFMTMGNHECYHSPCLLTSQNANYLAFMQALSPVASKPYYSVDVQTSLGLARFVFVADNGWDSAQQSWLEQTLTWADTHATYTIVAKHHPESDTSVADNTTIMQVIRSHKFALLLTGHNHKYYHEPRADSGRDVIIGNGGAPLVAGGTFNGYAMVDQLSDGSLQLTMYDLATGAPQDQFSVGANP